MSEFHVKVVRIGPITKHSNAETLSTTNIHGGYPVIFRTGEYKEGDLAVYVPIDSLVPKTDPRWTFLGEHNRIKAKRLRGVFSMGLLTPADPSWIEGQDVREALQIEKYEPPGEDDLSTGGGLSERDPGLMPTYTDIEGFRRWPDVIIEGEPVVLSEKIHGECVIGTTLVSMGDDSRKYIKDIKVGDEVLGVDAHGCLTATKVTTIFRNGPANKWLKVTGKRRGAGRGSHYFAVRCTPEHKFWNPQTKTYTNASDLQPGAPVLMIRSEMGLTPVQEQVLLGKLLGDGSLVEHDHVALVQWNHRKEDGAYSDWTARALGTLATDAQSECVSGYGTTMVHRNTGVSFWIKQMFGSMIENGPKKVPAWVADALTPLAVAFWYMDDGSLTHNEGQEDRAAFAVCGFTESDCDVLIRGLARLGVVATFYEAEGYSRLRLSSDNAERLFLLVAPYIPSCMQRKLPERYRGHQGWLPPSTQEYKPALVEQVVTAVEVDTTVSSQKYDIETETHNYFAHGVLVHNSSRYVYHVDSEGNGRLWVGSRTQIKKNVEYSQWWRAARY